MKKVMMTLITAIALISMISCGAKTVGEDGIYQAEAKGYHGPVKVEVEITKGKIADIHTT